MPLTDQARIARERLNPRILALWRALVPLKTVVSFMNTGAHPDDEMSALLAVLATRDGIDISYACSTRGEGGQNDIGTETTEALGVLRSAEMERACDAIGLRMYWLSQSPGDTIFDFGFSKSGVETMGKWGRERTLKRFVDILRTERPDIICPTFLDIPGQHGHHRAMTEAAHQAMGLAADSSYTDSELPPWQVKKLYLPAFSGAGQAYDDDLPPPPVTLTIEAKGSDPISGWSYERIGQQSRAFHKTQAMGSWIAAGNERDWPLHLAESRVDGPDDSLGAGLPKDLAALGAVKAQEHIEATIAAFPDYPAVLKNAVQALQALDGLKVAEEFAHKIERKRQQLAHVIRLASGAEVHAYFDKDALRPDDEAAVTIETRDGLADLLETSLVLPNGWSVTSTGVRLQNAEISNSYPDTYLPHMPSEPYVSVKLTVGGIESETRLPFEITPLVLPSHAADVSPLKDVINIAHRRRDVEIQITNVSPSAAKASLSMPENWESEAQENGFLLRAPGKVSPGRHKIQLKLDGEDAQTMQLAQYDHIQPRALVQQTAMQIQVIDCAIPTAKIGYVGAGNDRIDFWLDRMGCNVTVLTDDDLKSDQRLAQFDSIVIGIFAIKFRPELAVQLPRLHAWTRAGGTLLTLYHRPWDNWDKDKTAPAMLEIGQPSLRWRVTDENAAVKHLADHPVLSHPNKIGADDWEGWHKERGLYFAKSWAADYTPLLEMADFDEAPHQGALLTADVGKGRHSHCALILHHQMEKLVPGAFRLMANLLAKRS